MRIGARGSDLAQWQARWVADRLAAVGITCEQVIVETLGDQVRDRPLNQLGAQGVFTKELEDALLRDDVDLAVHSFKDMALQQPDPLGVVAISEREDPADLLVVRRERHDPANRTYGLPPAAIVGTSAVRRAAQLAALVPGLEMRDLRGNVPTRLRKLAEGQYDAIFLASAGARRLGLDLADFHVVRLDPERFVPSPAQGALAVEMRTDHPQAAKVREAVHHDATAAAVTAERDLLAAFGGGCSLPLGAHVVPADGGGWRMRAFWGDAPGGPRWADATATDPAALAGQVQPKLVGAE